MSKIALLLAAYNSYKFLKTQIDSILNQEDVQVDLFISDDISTYQILKIIHFFCDKHKNVRYIKHLSVGGLAKNFYLLINQIDTKKFNYISLVDQDNVWPDYKLSRAIEQLQQKKAHAYSSDIIAADEKEKFLKIIKRSQPQKNWIIFLKHWARGAVFS